MNNIELQKITIDFFFILALAFLGKIQKKEGNMEFGTEIGIKNNNNNNNFSFRFSEIILPAEISQMILSYLGKDLKSIALVCKSWKIQAIEAGNQEVKSVNNFLKFLIEKLPPDKETGIGKDIPAFSNLREAKSFILSSRKDILNILKDLKQVDLKNIEELSKNTIKPHFFKNIFDLALLYKQIDETASIPLIVFKSQALLTISDVLIEKVEIDEAIEVVKKIPNKTIKRLALLKISKVLIEKNEIDNAIEVVKMIPYESSKEEALSEILKVLIERSKIDKAIEVAKMISHENLKWEFLQDISKALIKKGEVDKAKEVAEMIAPQILKRYVLFEISKALIKK